MGDLECGVSRDARRRAVRPLSVRLEKEWRELSEAEVKKVGGELGVYEIADATDATIYIGYAGGNSIFGLRSELRRHLEAQGPGRRFRYEVNMQYLSRWNELLAVHRSDHGGLPAIQGSDTPLRVGRVDPGSR